MAGRRRIRKIQSLSQHPPAPVWHTVSLFFSFPFLLTEFGLLSGGKLNSKRQVAARVVIVKGLSEAGNSPGIVPDPQRWSNVDHLHKENTLAAKLNLRDCGGLTRSHMLPTKQQELGAGSQ